MNSDRGERKRRRQRLAPGRIPDPLRAHGAWVYLIVSLLAGVLIAGERGHLPALMAGGGFVGGLVLVGALATAGSRAAVWRAFFGVLLLVGSALAALHLGADRSFLPVSLLALPPTLAAAGCAAKAGFLSPGALSWGVTALAVAAPTAAGAGGAPPRSAILLLAILAPFFFWRTWRLARALGRGWTRRRFERQGLIESGLAVAWTALAVVLVRTLHSYAPG